jgi:hypothetical protein
MRPRTKWINVQNGHHELGRSSTEENSSSDRSFGIVFAVVFFLLAARSLWHGYSTWPVHIVMALGLLLIGLFRPALLAPLNKIWTKFGSISGKIVSPIVLGGLFFLVIAPAAFIFRALGQGSFELAARPGRHKLLACQKSARAYSRKYQRSVLGGVEMSFLYEFWRFMRARKKYWLLPIMFMMVVFGGLLVLAQGSAVAPFIYTLF